MGIAPHKAFYYVTIIHIAFCYLALCIAYARWLLCPVRHQPTLATNLNRNKTIVCHVRSAAAAFRAASTNMGNTREQTPGVLCIACARWLLCPKRHQPTLATSVNKNINIVCHVRSAAAVFRATLACTCSKTMVVSKTVWMHGCCAKWLTTEIKPNVLNSKTLWLQGVRHFCKFAMRYRGGISTFVFFNFLVCRVRSLAAVCTRHTPVACFCFAHWSHGC